MQCNALRYRGAYNDTKYYSSLQGLIHMDLYNHKDVLKVYTDLKPRTLISWVDKGLLSPQVKASGTGTRNQYSVNNLVEIGVIRELASYGMPHNVISSILKELSNKARLTEDDGYDVVFSVCRSYVSGYKRRTAHVGHIQVGSRSNFAREASELVFGERQVEESLSTAFPEVGSAIIVSLADIWEYIKARL